VRLCGPAYKRGKALEQELPIVEDASGIYDSLVVVVVVVVVVVDP